MVDNKPAGGNRRDLLEPCELVMEALLVLGDLRSSRAVLNVLESAGAATSSSSSSSSSQQADAGVAAAARLAHPIVT